MRGPKDEDALKLIIISCFEKVLFIYLFHQSAVHPIELRYSHMNRSYYPQQVPVSCIEIRYFESIELDLKGILSMGDSGNDRELVK